MSTDMNSKGLFLNIELGDLRKSAEARNTMIQNAAARHEEQDKAEPQRSKEPNFVQSYTGKGMLLDIIV